jgi:hypothetical protein
MVDVSTVTIVIASIGLLTGVIYYILDIKHRSRLRQTESLIKLSPWFNMDAKEMQEAITLICSIEYKDYNDYLEKYSGKPESLAVKIVGNYFEGVGILVSRKLVEADLVYDFWGDLIQSSWEAIEQIVNDMRKDCGDPNMFLFWEKLYHEMRKRRDRTQTLV